MEHRHKSENRELIYKKYRDGGWEDTEQIPPDETSVLFIVNGRELVTIQCSPEGIEDLGAGFLFTNGVIDSINEIETMRFDPGGGSLIIQLNKNEFPVPGRFIVTSGFGGGPVFDLVPPEGSIRHSFAIPAQSIINLMSAMKNMAVKYQKSGGIHATALCSLDDIVFLAEDVGRQNSMDKVIGHCLSSGVSFDDKALLTTGRVSFEMIMKTMRAGIPVLASLSAPTSKAVELASRCGISLAGYVTDDEFIAYTHGSVFVTGRV